MFLGRLVLVAHGCMLTLVVISHLSMFVCQVPIIDFDTVPGKRREEKGVGRTPSALCLRAVFHTVSRLVPRSVSDFLSRCLLRCRRLPQSVPRVVGVSASRCLPWSVFWFIGASVRLVVRLVGVSCPCVFEASQPRVSVLVSHA